LRDYGIKEIIVKDNGSGISEKDFQLLGMKHTTKAFFFNQLGKRGVTSKIREFKDIETLKSFGFRGEALYAICGLGDVLLQTKTAEKDLG